MVKLVEKLEKRNLMKTILKATNYLNYTEKDICH